MRDFRVKPEIGSVQRPEKKFELTHRAHPGYCRRPMSRKCVKTGKGTAFGNTRSHSLRASRRPFKVNMQKKRIFDAQTGEYKTMKIATSYLRTLAKRMQEGKKA
jgi:large subunit ribosomal protein L28